MKKIFLITLLFFSFHSYSQSFLNQYKYAIVDSKFDFVKTPDKYGTSSLVKFLFNKIGMKAFLDTDEIPSELSKNRCQSVFVTVVDKSSMITIKSAIELKDCFGKTLHTSEIGKSKVKEYKRGYYQAIKRAFNSIERLNYRYDESLVAKEPRKELKEPKKIHSENKTVPKKETQVVKEVETKNNTVPNSNYTLLYAQETKNGFQLVDSKPQIIFVLLETNQEGTYILKGKDGILTKKGNYWFAEYYKEGQLVGEYYAIKF